MLPEERRPSDGAAMGEHGPAATVWAGGCLPEVTRGEHLSTEVERGRPCSATAAKGEWRPLDVASGSQTPEVASGATRVSVRAAPPVCAAALSGSCSSVSAAVRTRMIAFRRPIAFDTIRSCGQQQRAGLSSYLRGATIKTPNRTPLCAPSALGTPLTLHQSPSSRACRSDTAKGCAQMRSVARPQGWRFPQNTVCVRACQPRRLRL